MKLHLCCGDVYLTGYVNCDIDGILVAPGFDVTQVTTPTTLENYYAGHELGKRNYTFIDQRIDLTVHPFSFADSSVSEIVMINAIEHFTLQQARAIIGEFERICKLGARLLIDFPDIYATVERYYADDPEFCMRHIYCNQRNDYLSHRWGYTKKTFTQLMGNHWALKFREIVQHAYPVIGCEATFIGQEY